MKIDFGPNAGGLVAFKSRTEFNEFLARQSKAWSDLIDTTMPYGQEIYNSLPAYWDAILSQSSSFPTTEYDDSMQSNVDQYAHPKNLIAKTSTDGLRLKEILVTQGARAAYGALRHRSGQNLSDLNTEMFDGAVLYSLLRSGLSPKALEISKTAVQATANQLNSENEKFSEELEKKSLSLTADTNKAISTFSNFMSEAENKLSELQKRNQSLQDADQVLFSKFMDTSKANWQTLRDTFETQLAIEAPVKYWKRKARIHKRSYDNWKELPPLWGILGAVVLAFLIYFCLEAVDDLIWNFINFMRSHDPKFVVEPKEVLKITSIIIGSTTLFLATLYVWALRFSVRMMMTEHHLHIDAEARATMAETYLALTKVGTTSDAERAVVMSALFKPVTDGIVKDDSLPALSPAAFLSNALNTTHTR